MMRLANLTIAIVATMITLSSCSMSQKVVNVSVKNPTTIDRENEIVEVDWSKINKKLSLTDDQSIVVTNSSGEQVPYQLVTNGEKSPVTLIFPVSLNNEESKTYQVKVGTPQEFAPLVYGRLVPERKDDFTWENNRVAYRVYGPALQATGEISNGLDIWVKRTEDLVINKWYKDDLSGKASYHRDNGEGVDFYKVGPTLGLGMTAPIYDDNIVLGKNFTSVEVLDNGPLRISFKLHYAPYMVGDNEVTETRVFTLDAYSRLNKVEKVFDSKDKTLNLATGFVISGQGEQTTFSDNEAGIIAYEVAEDKNWGIIYTGAINLMGYENSKIANNHFLGYNHFDSGKKYTYYTGGGWNRSGFTDFNSWTDYLKRQRTIYQNPIQVKVK